VLICATLLYGWPNSAACQDAAPSPSTSSPVDNAADDHRMFNMVPNWNTINDPDQPIVPLSAGEKFENVEHYFDPFTFVFTGVTAGLEQATNEKAGYGQGALGYSKRYGADFTDAFTNELFVTAVFPALLHQDPRYYRLGRGNGWKRTGYALSRILIGHSDSGAAEINASEFLGNFVSGALSMTYYPQNQRSISEVFTRMSVQIGYDSIFNVLKEFYPDLKRKFHHDH
jgi:hypothetical protein